MVASFLATLVLPVAILMGVAAVRACLFKKPWPRQLTVDALQAMAITVGISLVICLVLRWTGFFESQFFQPSQRDFGIQRELGLAPEEVTFESRDGTRLNGWLLKAEGDAKGTVIHLHGSGRNITFTVGHAAWLRERGFHVFAFDYRGYGKSAGKPSRRGVVEDSVAAIAYVRARSDLDPARICLWGQSMGGPLAIVAADAAAKEGVRAVVCEAGYASGRQHVMDKMGQLGPLWLMQWAGGLVTSDIYAAEAVVKRLAPTPLLLVHGTEDRGVLPMHSERLFARAAEPKEIWRIAGAKHLDIFRAEEQRARLVEYLERACGGTGGP